MKYEKFECANALEKYNCKRCAHFQTNYLIHLRQHLAANHRFKTVYELSSQECTICCFETHSQYMMSRHKCSSEKHAKQKSTSIDQIKWFACGQCRCKYSNEYSLKQHIRYRHVPEEQKLCINGDQSSLITMLKNSLKEHIKQEHATGQDKWYSCEHCMKKYELKSSLNRHIEVKHVYNPPQWYHCDQCGHKFQTKRGLKFHTEIQHVSKEQKQWFHCDKCDYKSISRLYLKTHVKWKHTPEDQIVWFCCDLCSHKCKSRSMLKRHLNSRHKPAEKRQWFFCDLCNCKTTSRSYVKRHIKLKHTQDIKQEGFIATKEVTKQERRSKDQHRTQETNVCTSKLESYLRKLIRLDKRKENV